MEKIKEIQVANVKTPKKDQKENTNKKKGDRQKLFILCVIIVIGISLVLLRLRPTISQKNGLELDSNATIGVLEGIDMEKRMKELQNQLDESMIAFSINSTPVFHNGKSEGNLMIENPEHNNKIIVAELYDSKTSELLYQSKAIPPGAYIQNIKLNKELDKGTYDATIYLLAYSIDTQEYIGKTGAEVKLTIQQ